MRRLPRERLRMPEITQQDSAPTTRHVPITGDDTDVQGDYDTDMQGGYDDFGGAQDYDSDGSIAPGHSSIEETEDHGTFLVSK